jgi:hypothetical protein
MTLPTGSGIDRAMKCIASTALPQTRSISAASTLGTVIHDYLMNVSLQGPDEALRKVPEEHQAACAAIDLERLKTVDPKSFAAEVAYAYSIPTDSAREIGRGINRAYEGKLEPGEMAGTEDVVGITEDAVVVYDYKSGFGHVPPAAENWQLKFGALAAARTYGKGRALVGIIRLQNGDPWHDEAELDELDLEAAAVELRALALRVKEEESRLRDGAHPRTVTGSHCKYCPALPHCPAQTSLVRELGFAAIDPGKPVITEENVVALYEKLEAVDRLRDMMWESLDAYATAHPVQLPNGDVYGPCETEKETIDPHKGSVLLAEKYDSKVALDAVKQEPAIPWNRLELALKAWMQRHPGSKLKDLKLEARQLLREKGALRVEVKRTVKRFKPKPELPEGEKGEAA